MRLAIIMATSGVDEEGMELRRRFLQSTCAPGTQITMVANPDAPPSIESAWAADRAAVTIGERVRTVERDGFDAAIIWCGDDPGLEAARELVKIPVVGPLSASMALASQIGDRFSIITSRGSGPLARRRVRLAQMESRLASVEVVDVAVLEIGKQAHAVRDDVIAAVRRSRDRGADCCILGCMAMYGLARTLGPAVSIPVIDPGTAAVQMAEALVRMGFTAAGAASAHEAGAAVETLGEGF